MSTNTKATKRKPVRVIREQIKDLKVSVAKHSTFKEVSQLDFNSAEIIFKEAEAAFNASKVQHNKNIQLVNQLEGKLKNLVKEEADVTRRINRAPAVSDHAVIRYIERVMNFDVDQIRREIIGKDGQNIKTMDDGPIERDGYQLEIMNNTVVTVIT